MNPSLLFVLTDGPQAHKHRYYTTTVEAAKALAAGHGWATQYVTSKYGWVRTAPEFGAFTAMFMDRPGLDLTDFVLTLTAQLVDENKARAEGVWRQSGSHEASSAMEETEYRRLCRATRQSIREELDRAIDAYVKTGAKP